MIFYEISYVIVSLCKNTSTDLTNMLSILKSTFVTVFEKTVGTLRNRRHRPDDGNRKRDISLETSLRMYNTL